MLPIDLPELFQREITKQRRPNDGLLHASSDLTGSLRHSQLRLAGAPYSESAIISDIRLQTGILWHEWFHDALECNGIPFFHEIDLEKHMPEGWAGTADWIFWHPDYKAFVLGDLKTTRGEALHWINKDGAKKEHIWQLSAYYYALLNMGFPMVKGFAIMYWPLNNTTDKDSILPSVQECFPIEKEELLQVMSSKWEKSQEYLNSLERNSEPTTYITNRLADPIDREQKVLWNKGLKVFDLKLVPHWMTKFCPYPDELCDCNTQSSTKVGQYSILPNSNVEYSPRTGYEDVEPVAQPTAQDIARRAKEIENA